MRNDGAHYTLLVVLVTAFRQGCRVPVDERSQDPVGPSDPAFETTVHVRFLGVAGISIRLGSDVVLTAPLCSNPPLVEEAFALIFPDKARIDRFHPETRDVVLPAPQLQRNCAIGGGSCR